jgi:hypothetical protein
MGTTIPEDVLKGLYGSSVEMIIAPTDGKRIIRLQSLPEGLIIFPIVKFSA